MAEVVSKVSLYSPRHHHYHHHHHRHRISYFPICSNTYGYSNKSVAASMKLNPLGLRSVSSFASSSCFSGQKIHLNLDLEESPRMPKRANSHVSSRVQMSLGIGKVQKWWEKGLEPNMKEVRSAQDLVNSLFSAGDKLVVVDFFSPGCGGCRALHPKICQLAEMNPDVQFLQVNYEEHKSMCYSLNVHVLPFFRFYRGAHGRLCSFSCTNATIKKFKDALAKHSPDRCSLGPPRGLEEKELLALSANKDLSFNFTPKPTQPVHMLSREDRIVAEAEGEAASPLSLSSTNPQLTISSPSLTVTSAHDVAQEKTLVATGR
ncbi:thioredoxin-like 1-1, chloroplastic [Malania oleifera]|uniref:thioredoxin-like 1-1, chloroplastic n=1 Tax=Malania oleifera TaxID=397392 RepID=UPI0025AE260A|nr:thioredoxin-like 1-1, chloroplastic [Malania oleifera]